MAPRGEVVEIDDVIVIQTTDSALLCLIENEKFWIPRSQIASDSEIEADAEKNAKGSITIAKWLAVEKGLVDDD